MMPFPRFPLRGALFASLVLASLPALAMEPFSATYQASVKGVKADAQMTLSAAGGDRWTYELRVNSPVANLRQSTTFSENGGNWRPLTGVDSTQVLIKRTQKNASYDWNAREARWSGDVKPDRVGPVKLQDGDLDGMLVHLALVRDVKAGRAANYRVVENGVARQHNYRVVGTESITVGGQPRTATKLSRSSEDKQILVWVVDDLPVPARILQREDGKDALDLSLKAVR